MIKLLNTALQHDIPLSPIPPVFQFKHNPVDLTPCCSIEVVALGEEVFDDDRIDTITVQEHNYSEPFWVVEVLFLKYHALDCSRPSVRCTNEVLQHNKVCAFDR